MLGGHAENDACQFLQQQGLILIQKNFRVKGGEIDLIMRDQSFLVFVEVKSRTKTSHGDAIEMISSAKQRRIIHAATCYLQINQLWNTERCRFDVIGMVGKTLEKVWIKNAFEVRY